MNDNIAIIYSLLDKSRIKEALTLIVSTATSLSQWKIWDEADQLLVSYNMMLKYTIQGIKDSNRKEMIRKTGAQAYSLADRLAFASKTIGSFTQAANIYYRVSKDNRTLEILKQELEKYTENIETVHLLFSNDEINPKRTEIAKRHEENINLLFEKIFINTKFSEEDYTITENILSSLLVQEYDKAIIISAMTMSLLNVFDEKKFMLLLSAYNDKSVLLSQRALVGIVIILQCKPQRVKDYPEIIGRIALLKDEARFNRDIMNIQLQLLIANETDSVNKKMREEIIPDMIKGTSKGYRNFISGIEESENGNPDWQNMINDSKFTDKIREISDLQTSGADIYMSSFSMLKNYSFFFTLSHWFYPFFNKQQDVMPIVDSLESDKLSMINVTLSSSFFCDSDKYSLCFTLNSIPGSQRNMFVNQLSQNNEAGTEEHDALMAISKKPVTNDVISRQYIQDLYRFFKLWHYKNEQEDIFTNKFALWNNPFLKESIANQDTLSAIGNLLIKHNHPQEAFEVYDILTKEDQNDAESWQKKGYVLQKLERYDDAIFCYTKSDMLKPDSQWTNHRLAQCYKKSSSYEKAIEYYRKVESQSPDNLTITAQIGQCLININHFEEALNYFFKIQYNDENNVNSIRAIAWCMLQTDHYDDAIKYINKIVQKGKESCQDLINMGHIYLIKGNINDAVAHYKRAASLINDNEKMHNEIIQDKALLINKGIKEEDIMILPDLIF